MSNPNIAMLENVISAAVSTQYKEVPPTEEEFINLAQTMRSNMSAFAVTDDEFADILVRLRASIVIQMDVGVFINDRNTPHKSWLPARRADLDFFFWNRYKKYLEEIKHWNPRVTATLDKVSDEIVDLLGDPESSEPFQRRGLVLGDVQSGKTANYTAISNKAADTGYRIIIVLAGMMENLRQQTQSRLDAEFSGRKSEYYLDPKAEQEIKNLPVGVGRYGVQKRIAAFTSVSKDFDINVLQSNDLNLQSVSDPVVLVVKKNKRILNNLIKWLSKSRDDTTGKIMLPMLLIDDEADNASVNTRSEDDSPAAINACIRKLRIRKYRLLIFTDADVSDTLKNLDNLDIGGIPAECQIWDIERLFRVCCSDLGRQNIEIDFREYIPEGIPCLEASSASTAEYNSYLCIIPGKVLADIYDKYGSQLLEGNVRSFLSTKVAVNNKIRETILKCPSMFFA